MGCGKILSLALKDGKTVDVSRKILIKVPKFDRQTDEKCRQQSTAILYYIVAAGEFGVLLMVSFNLISYKVMFHMVLGK